MTSWPLTRRHMHVSTVTSEQTSHKDSQRWPAEVIRAVRMEDGLHLLHGLRHCAS